MTTLNIIDSNNWVRVKMEESLGGASIMNLWTDLMMTSNSGIQQLFVFDGYNSRQKRRSLYPEYKAKRKPADQSFFDGLNFFKELLAYAPANVQTVSVPEYEADDVIANIAYKWQDMYDKINIISTDKDLTQLRTIPNVNTLATPKVDPKWVRLYKTFVGDSSDNIPGVHGFGDGAWDKTSDDWKDRMTVLFYLRNGNPEMDTVLRLCKREGMSDKLLDKIRDTNLALWYKLVSFYRIDERIIIKTGNDNVSLAQEKLAEYEL